MRLVFFPKISEQKYHNFFCTKFGHKMFLNLRNLQIGEQSEFFRLLTKNTLMMFENKIRLFIDINI